MQGGISKAYEAGLGLFCGSWNLFTVNAKEVNRFWIVGPWAPLKGFRAGIESA